ncbi:MAG: heavy metal-binding domain-containing protein [Ginsengibacter sp.]
MKKLFFIVAILIFAAFFFTACSGGQDKVTTEQLANNETYTCTMNNEVMGDHPGKCPKCEMKLVKQKMTPEQEKMMKEETYVKPNEQ